MATKETEAPVPNPAIENVLAARYRREMQRSALRAYRSAVHEFAKDSGCSEEQAKAWLASAGVVEPTNGG